jgi:hypothetical protein
MKKKFVLSIALVLGLVASGAPTTTPTTEAPAQTETSTTEAPTSTEAPTTTKAPVTTTTKAPTTTTQPEPQFTRSEENAIRSAESYLDFTAFSRSGLVDQLEYEGFTTEQATYGVDMTGL